MSLIFCKNISNISPIFLLTIRYCYIFLSSWCACSECEEWTKLNQCVFKIILIRQNNPCLCICSFCDNDCNDLQRLSPRFLMNHMLCPGARHFAQSSVILYKWDCILNRYISYDFNILNHTFLSLVFFFSRCPQQNCFQYRRGTLFSCPKSDMYSTTSFVDYEVWRRLISQSKLGSTER